MATIKQISELSGVSRGTVDRVLNGRGHVSPEKERLVRSIAEQVGYTPNRAGKALAARKKSYSICVLLASEGNPFFSEVIRGVREAERELHDYGVKVVLRTLKGYDVSAQVSAMEELGKDASALILNPINDPAVAEKINALSDRGVQVYTVNTDIGDCRRLCYVGSDYFEGGRIACGMLGLLTGGVANVGILTGSVHILGHKQRIDGFLDVMYSKYPRFRFLSIMETEDDDMIGFESTRKMLTDFPEIDTIFLAAAGVYGACRAVQSFLPGRKLHIVSFDHIPQTGELMQAGLIHATICQQPFAQGYEAVKLAFNSLMSGAPPQEQQYIVKNEIRILENL
ncbi:LacI family DNA-binding transcriptional regulator [Christensenella tenuis]|nr:LacI family DNA-binding transcriptional regulator [Christensenella tenuis]